MTASPSSLFVLATMVTSALPAVNFQPCCFWCWMSTFDLHLMCCAVEPCRLEEGKDALQVLVKYGARLTNTTPPPAPSADAAAQPIAA